MRFLPILLFASSVLGALVPEANSDEATPTILEEGALNDVATKTENAAFAAVTCNNRTKFKFYGVNQAGAEFGQNVIPGVLGTHYTWPSPSSIDYFTSRGFNSFRIAFLMERLVAPSTGVKGPHVQAYLQGLTSIVNYITSKGAYAILDPHNYLRYNGQLMTNTNESIVVWKNLATVFKNNSRVIFDLQNEPYGIDATTTAAMMQAGINGVRAAGATSQMIFVQGTAWSGAWSWTLDSGNANAFKNLKDPNNNLAVEMHQYPDSDSSGTSTTCVSPTIAVERLRAATEWLKANNLKGFLGEFGGGSNDVCIQAWQQGLCYMQQQGGVWIGALWWAAGPWWGDYFQSIEPPNGPSISRILPEVLTPFL
ncbi:endoglucanase [Pterulicium gracile]|uniref:cellulase n=1 Tax=Pterulicium gracile TaxID=1884261 RepID=A0A5C3QBI3_9AGAR|nr:endoglucanase [Pterula gracilis]